MSLIRVLASAGPTPHRRAWFSRLNCPVRDRSTTASWNTTALARRAPSGSVVTSKPATRAWPEVGSTVVVSMPMVVDLPGPVGPEEAEHLARADLEVNSGHGFDAARIDLAELAHFD